MVCVTRNCIGRVTGLYGLTNESRYFLTNNKMKQEHPRGSIDDPQGLCQDGLNSLSHSGLETPIIIAHVYDISNCKRKKMKLGQVGALIAPIHMTS